VPVPMPGARRADLPFPGLLGSPAPKSWQVTGALPAGAHTARVVPEAAGHVLPASWTASNSLAQASSVTLGFHTAADLLSPLALFHFAAVARSQDPPSEDSKGPASYTVIPLAVPQGPRAHRWPLLLHRTWQPAPPGPGLLPLPLPVLRPGVHAELPRTPALPVQQVGPCLVSPSLLTDSPPSSGSFCGWSVHPPPNSPDGQ
jgi:hypothetical protein